jgi:Peptidase family M48
MSAGHELRLLGGLVLSTIVLVLPTTTTCLAADALSPGVHLMAQAAPSADPSDRLVQGEWSLPRRHQYEVYDARARHYAPVDVATLPMRLDRGEWIHDQTAGVWVTHPNGGRNPDYLARSQEPAASPRGSADLRRPPTTADVDPAPAARLQRVMVPLIQHMDHRMPLDQVKVAITHDPQINAASGGGGQFFVTSGLLEKANDDRLRSVLAHELAHQDLNHVTKAKVLGVGLNLGAALLNQVFPGSGAIAPLAGELVARKYSRTEEYAADRHGVELLRRAGYPKEMMIETLTWLMQVSGPSSGGFFATHPGTGDRIDAVRKMP